MYHIKVIARIGAVASLLPVLGSCSDSAAPQPSPLHASPIVQNAQSATQRVVFNDATERLIPAMADHGAGLRLQGILAEFAAAYNAGDDEKARRALIAARKVLSRLDATEHAANLSAIRLSLREAEALLITTEESQPPSS